MWNTWDWLYQQKLSVMFERAWMKKLSHCGCIERADWWVGGWIGGTLQQHVVIIKTTLLTQNAQMIECMREVSFDAWKWNAGSCSYMLKSDKKNLLKYSQLKFALFSYKVIFVFNVFPKNM